MGALHQHGALVLGQGIENLEHELAARLGRAYGVLQEYQVQPAAAQVLDDLNQVLGGAPQPIGPPNNDRITGPGGTQQFFPVRLMDLHAGHRIGVEVVAARLAQGVELKVEHLLAGTDAGVAEFLCGKKGVSDTGKKRSANLRYFDYENQFRIPFFLYPAPNCGGRPVVSENGSGCCRTRVRPFRFQVATSRAPRCALWGVCFAARRA